MQDVVNPILLDLLAGIDFDAPNVRAAWVAALYFGTFIGLGWGARRALRSLMAERSEDLSEVQKQAGDSARKGESFLLGIWRKRL